MVDLRGRIAIITGTDTVSGAAIAAGLAGEGVSLMLLSAVPVRGVAEDLAERHDIRCLAAAIDVGDPAAVDRVVMHAEQHLGPVDLLVNLADPAVLTRALLPTMIARGRGHIVTVGAGVETDGEHPGVVLLTVPADAVSAAFVVAIARGEHDEPA